MEIPWFGSKADAQRIRGSLSRIINEFHTLSYGHGGWKQTKWMGVTTYKIPNDLWHFQEIIFEVRPDFIIETGTFQGGSALFMAHILEIVGKGHIITIDVNRPKNPPKHDRLSYILGSSTAPETVEKVKDMLKGAETVLVTLDSSHRTEHVLREMELYSTMVTKGSYLIVEDSNVNGHPIIPGYRENIGDEPGGPMEAIDAFMKTEPNFEIDIQRHRYLMTHNPRGYLRKTA